ncbi:four-carbon acid sugar kinase family protein [Pseudalkalibacillus decolorationis]|uniref:four-carbon acid sugar kinase family protein n=1 Tax=Pseudalkalibacillus decolorationis TaxID=163879 RepID=UPI0021480D3C|nr:four-carbon acid sugar kinase family protein [Pseudalkalibacillus decolorationis]
MIGVIADDLTGANATGVRLTKQGFRTATVVRGAPFPDTRLYDALSIDTDSRYAPVDVCQRRVAKAISQLKSHDTTVYCKRIDSTVRGHFGYEIDTMLEELGMNSVAVVCPSYPKSGRVTTGGYLLVDGVPLQETDVARDPVKPLTQSYVPVIIENQSQYKVEHIPLSTVLNGSEAVRNRMTELIEKGTRIISVDAVTDEEIDHIAKAMTFIKTHNLFPCDPGPLTASYAREYVQQKVRPVKLLVSVGSATTITGRQLEYLYSKAQIAPVMVDANELATYGDGWEQEIEHAVKEALVRIENDNLLVVTTFKPGAKRIDLMHKAKIENTSEDALAKRITDGLAKISRKIIESSPHKIEGCFSSGGDVTASLCAVGGASGIRLKDEVLPLVAYGTFIGGHFDGLSIVTKGGMVGDKKAIYECVQHLKSKLSQFRKENHQ